VTRRERIVLLLASLPDLLPAPKGSLRTTSGLGAVRRVACPDCGDTQHPGWHEDRFGTREPCETCGGRVTKTGRKVRGRGRVTVDPMDADLKPIRTSDDNPTRPARMVGCDACGGYPDRGGSGVGKPHVDEEGREYHERCPYCDGTGWRPKASDTAHLFVPPDERDSHNDRLRSAGSYADLERELAGLHSLQRRMVRLKWVEGDGLELDDPTDDGLAESGMLQLERRMPADIRVPREVIEADKRRREHLRRLKGLGRSREAVQARDKQIRRLIRQNKSSQWIAWEYGLSVSQVNRIVDGGQEAA